MEVTFLLVTGAPRQSFGKASLVVKSEQNKMDVKQLNSLRFGDHKTFVDTLLFSKRLFFQGRK